MVNRIGFLSQDSPSFNDLEAPSELNLLNAVIFDSSLVIHNYPLSFCPAALVSVSASTQRLQKLYTTLSLSLLFLPADRMYM